MLLWKIDNSGVRRPRRQLSYLERRRHLAPDSDSVSDPDPASVGSRGKQYGRDGREWIADCAHSIKVQQKPVRCCRADGTSRSSCGRLLKWLTSLYHLKCAIINAWGSAIFLLPLNLSYFIIFFISISNTAITAGLMSCWSLRCLSRSEI